MLGGQCKDVASREEEADEIRTNLLGCGNGGLAGALFDKPLSVLGLLAQLGNLAQGERRVNQ